jgi:tetratricopeptide (TPR) repeat protein
MRTASVLCLLAVASAALCASGCSRESKIAQARQRASEALKAGKLETARLEYQNVLQLVPNDADAPEKLGHIWLERGAPLRAMPHLVQAGNLQPGNRDVRLKVLRIALAAGKLADARSGAVALLEKFPTHDAALQLLAEAVKGTEDYETAQRLWRDFRDPGAVGYHLATASLAMHRGEIEPARAALLRATGADPKSVDAHTTTALFHLAQRNTAAAAKSFQAAAEAAPVRSLARMRWIEFRQQTGAGAAAAADLEAILKEAPDYFPAWCVRAQFAAAEKKYDEALAHLGRVFAIDPVNYEARLVRAQIQAGQGATDAAVAELDKIIADYPQLPAPLFLLGQVHLQARNAEPAQAAFRRAIEQNPDHEQALAAWATVAMQRGDHQPVAAAMAQVLARRPNFVPAQGFFLDALAGLGRYDEINRMLEETVRQGSAQPQTYHLLGMVALRQQKPAEARRHFERTLELAPGAFATLNELVRLDLREGAAPQAEARLKPLLARQPESGPLQLLAATVLAQQGRWAETEAATTKALALGGIDVGTAYEFLGRSIQATRSKAETLAWLDALKPKPEHKPAALVMTGSIFHQLGEFARARDAYEQCLALQPEALAALNNLAVLYTERVVNLDRALELATRARQLAPGRPEIADTLGWILLKRGEPARALDLIKEAAAKLPNDPSIQFHLARAHHLLGQTEPARAAYRAAAAAPGDFDGKPEIAGLLAQLDRAP